MPDKTPLPPRDTALLARTAEMLALPQRVCRRRECRRRGRCGWFFAATGEPCCLANLDPAQRALFDELAEKVRVARDFGSWSGKLVFASAWRADRALQDAAVEAARPLVSGPALRRFRAFAARRESQPPPAHDGFMPPLKW